MSNTYHRIIRKMVIGFGNMFNNIALTRYNPDGSEDRRIKVPITYSPKEKYVARLGGDPELNKKVQITLPRMSFDLLGMNYDSTRKQVSNVKNYSDSGSTNSKFSQYNPVPYNFEFSLYIYVRNIEDGTQIVEHILPYFTPDYTIKLNLVPNMNVTKEIPILLNKVDYDIQYEGDQESEARIVIWTLSFTAKGFLYGPVTESKIIKATLTGLYNQNNLSLTDNVRFNMDPSGFGIYKLGETVYQGYSLGTSTGTARVTSYSNTTNVLEVTEVRGEFEANTNVIGVESQAERELLSFVTPENIIALIEVSPNPNTASSSNNYTYTTEITEFE